jgi:hypothetical protein
MTSTLVPGGKDEVGSLKVVVHGDIIRLVAGEQPTLGHHLPGNPLQIGVDAGTAWGDAG